MKSTYIVIEGDLVSGHRFYGPFNSFAEAQEFEVRCLKYTRIVELEK